MPGTDKLKVENKTSIELSGYIGEWPYNLDSIEGALCNVNPNEILDITISSNGGSYIQAMKIYDRLCRHKGSKRIRISPIAGSAGAVLALDPSATVSIPANGLLFHHHPELIQDEAKKPEDLRKAADELDKIGSTLVEMVMARTKKSKEVVTQMLDKGTWFTAEQAKEFGLVDHILPLDRQRLDVRNLVLPEQIVAHVEKLNTRSNTMALKDVCGKLNITVTDEMKDGEIETALTNHVSELEKQLKNVGTTQLKVEKKSFPDAIVNVLVKGRKASIQSLLEEGKIVAAVADDLTKQFANKDTIINCVDEDCEAIDGFDLTMSALKKNEAVINYNGGGRKVSLPQEGDVEQKSGLVANAEKRAAK